jgi:hypothetical protein
MMTNQQGYAVLMLISTLCSYIEPKDTTKKFDKLRTQIRKGIQRLYLKNHNKFLENSVYADGVWERAKIEIANEGYVVSISHTLLALYRLIEETFYQSLWFSEKTFVEAINSIHHKYEETITCDVEIDSNHLVDIFCKHLGYQKPSKMKFIKQKVEGNLILEGKI